LYQRIDIEVPEHGRFGLDIQMQLAVFLLDLADLMQLNRTDSLSIDKQTGEQ